MKQETISFLPPMGATKTGEYYRSIELFEDIFKRQGVYYALAILYDSQYGQDDIKKMMELCKPKNSIK